MTSQIKGLAVMKIQRELQKYDADDERLSLSVTLVPQSVSK